MFYRHFCALLLVSHSLFSRALSLSVGLFSARLSLSTPPSLPQSTLASRRRCFCRRRCPVCFFFLFLIEICGLHQYLLFPCVFHVIKNLVQVFFFSPLLLLSLFCRTILYCKDGRIYARRRTFSLPPEILPLSLCGLADVLTNLFRLRRKQVLCIECISLKLYGIWCKID